LAPAPCRIRRVGCRTQGCSEQLFLFAHARGVRTIRAEKAGGGESRIEGQRNDAGSRPTALDPRLCSSPGVFRPRSAKQTDAGHRAVPAVAPGLLAVGKSAGHGKARCAPPSRRSEEEFAFLDAGGGEDAIPHFERREL